jgi:hypothetical protein
LGVSGIASSQTNAEGTIICGNRRSSDARSCAVASFYFRRFDEISCKATRIRRVPVQHDGSSSDPGDAEETCLNLSWLDAHTVNLDLFVDSA